MGFISHLRDLIRFMQLTTSQRRLTFYSEGKNYWPHLEGMVRGVLDKSDINICYIRSMMSFRTVCLMLSTFLTLDYV